MKNKMIQISYEDKYEIFITSDEYPSPDLMVTCLDKSEINAYIEYCENEAKLEGLTNVKIWCESQIYEQ